MAAAEPDLIRLTGLRFSAIHGVYDFEREEPQSFVVDLTCELAPRPDADDLATTVDYAALSRSVEAVVLGDPVNLIETLAQRIATACLAEPLLERVTVTVHKPQAAMPVALDDVAVTITRSGTR